MNAPNKSDLSESDSACCKVEDVGGVRLITFNRPEARNAFNAELRDGLTAALAEAGQSSEIKAVVLTGEGTAFTAGVDLKELAALRESSQKEKGGDEDGDDSTAWTFLDILRDFPKPLFMAVNGVGVGLGTTILGFADIAIAGKSAKFKCPFTEMGVGAEASSTWLLPHLIGWQNATWLLLSSEWISAEEAKEMGLVYEVVEDDELLAVTMERAKKIAEQDLDAVVAIKKSMSAWRTDPITAAGKEEGRRFMELLARNEPND